MRSLIVVTVTLLLGYLVNRSELRLARTAPRRTDADGSFDIRVSWITLVGSTLLAAVVTALGVGITLLRGKEPLWGIILGSTFFSLSGFVGFWWTLAVALNRIRVRQDGIEARSPRGTRTIRWPDITLVDCWDLSPIWKWVTINDGSRVIRAPLSGAGTAELYGELQAKVPVDLWEEVYRPFERLCPRLLSENQPRPDA